MKAADIMYIDAAFINQSINFIMCCRFGAWSHIDAAYAGAASIVPEMRHLFQGVEHADSYSFNPHKVLIFVSFIE